MTQDAEELFNIISHALGFALWAIDMELEIQFAHKLLAYYKTFLIK